MLIIPAIDLRHGQCVRLRQGRKEHMTIYDGDPVDVARRFAGEGAAWLHVVDLDGAFAEDESPNRQTLQSLAAAIKIPIQFGGGLRRVEEVARALECGVARVVIGTLAVESPDTVGQLLALHGRDRIAVGIDARNGLVMTRGWEKAENLQATALAREVAALGVERIIYTDVMRDGVLGGPNVEETCALARASAVKVTASGGVSSLEDIEHLKQAEQYGVDSVIVGRALYEGRFTLAEAIRVAEG
jgi:phosphoribosylformimino-5-aminoimidazole carboxamide ribotide isomerase